MRRLDILIEDARRETDNTDYSESSGIQQSEFIRSANDAQERLQSLILQAHSSGTFEKEVLIQVQSQSETIDLPKDIFIGSRVISVFYSPNGQSRDFYILDQRRDRERINGIFGDPEFYIRKDNKLILVPAPISGGVIRLTFQRKLPKLDIRRATVSSVTLSGNSVNLLTLDPDGLDADGILAEDYMSVVSRRGTVKMKGIPVNSINKLTGFVSLEAGFAFEDGETISTGDFIVSGGNSTTHCQMPDIAEKYIIEYMKQRVHKRDSSVDQTSQNAELAAIEQEIVMSFAKPDMDVDKIPILQTHFLDYEPY